MMASPEFCAWGPDACSLPTGQACDGHGSGSDIAIDPDKWERVSRVFANAMPAGGAYRVGATMSGPGGDCTCPNSKDCPEGGCSCACPVCIDRMCKWLGGLSDRDPREISPADVARAADPLASAHGGNELDDSCRKAAVARKAAVDAAAAAAEAAAKAEADTGWSAPAKLAEAKARTAEANARRAIEQLPKIALRPAVELLGGDPDTSFSAGEAVLAVWHDNGDELDALGAACEKLAPKRYRGNEIPPLIPPPVLWRVERGDPPPDPGRPLLSGRCLLPTGNVGMLTGKGGMGKSALTFQIALAAASGDPGSCGLADLGLGVAPGPVIVWAMEDNGGVALTKLHATAVRWGCSDEAMGRVVIRGNDGGPLWTGPEYAGRGSSGGRCDAMEVLAAEMLSYRPRLIVIDPVASAVESHQADLATTRQFVAALQQLVEGEAAVLLVSHSSKEGRQSAADHPGQISGSAAWYDAARLCITATQPTAEGESVEGAVELTVTKANFGRTGPLAAPLLEVTTAKYRTDWYPAGLVPRAANGNGSTRNGEWSAEMTADLGLG